MEKKRQRPEREREIQEARAAEEKKVKIQKPWQVQKKAENSHSIKMIYKSGWKQSVLLISDVHFDNAKCKRKLLKKHLDQALERFSPIIINGDLFCLMQGKYDPRKSNSDLLPQYKNDDYVGSIIEDALRFFEPYKDLLTVVGYGNHETAFQSRNNIDVLKMFCRQIGCFAGGYQGWIRFLFEHESGGSRQQKVMRYNHGTGGGGEVTKGVLKASRNNAKADGVDIFFSGHIHEAWYLETPKHSLSKQGVPGHKNVIHIQSPTYKEEVGSGAKGWANEKEFPPKPLGGWWLNFTVNHNKIKMSVERAD